MRGPRPRRLGPAELNGERGQHASRDIGTEGPRFSTSDARCPSDRSIYATRAVEDLYLYPLPRRLHSTYAVFAKMCHNIIDGRFHLECQHFIPMHTRMQDCLRPNCLFSRRHAHPVGCRSPSCVRMMTTPQRNPIRMSETKCADCVMRERTGAMSCT